MKCTVQGGFKCHKYKFLCFQNRIIHNAQTLGIARHRRNIAQSTRSGTEIYVLIKCEETWLEVGVVEECQKGQSVFRIVKVSCIPKWLTSLCKTLLPMTT